MSLKVINVTRFLAVFILFVCVVNVVHAQNSTGSANPPTPTPTEAPFNFDKAYKDYVFTTDQYNKAHSDYLLARAQYLQAKTLASQTKAKEATSAMLEARDDVMATYLLALRQRLVESIGIDDTTKNGITSRVDTEVSWWRNHKSKIDSAGTLEDLVSDSNEGLTHYPTTEALSYEILATIPLGKEQVFRNSFNDLLSNTKTKISQIRTNGDHDTTNAERWVIETENKLTRSLEKEVEAQKLMPDLQTLPKAGEQSKKADIYNSVIMRLSESIQFLKEATGYMKEVIKQIKTKS